MIRHWSENGPPTYITSAGLAGWKPPVGRSDDEVIEDPAQLAAALAGFPGGRVI